MIIFWLLAATVAAATLEEFEKACSETTFASVMPRFPKKNYVVRNLTMGLPRRRRGCRLFLWTTPATPGCAKYDVGRYNERRSGVYTSSHYQNVSNAIDGFDGIRDVHMGLDLGAPIGTSIHAPLDGTIYGFGYNKPLGDYGHVIITEHSLANVTFWILFGHLSAKSVAYKAIGDPVVRGQPIASIGASNENGGWPPHLHLQISLVEPSHPHDMPGVVALRDRDDALRTYPDPRLLLGVTLYSSS